MYVGAAPSDSLKSKVGEESDAQKDGGYTTTKIWDHCQDLTVSFTDRGSGYILKHNIQTEQNILFIFKTSKCWKFPTFASPSGSIKKDTIVSSSASC